MKNDKKPAEEATADVTAEAETETEEATAQEEPAAAETAPEENPWQDKFIRLAADFENFKKRSRAEKDACYANAKADAVAALLPILDNLERALAAAEEDSPLKQGVEMVLTQASQAFTALGVTAVGQEGEPFDPELHNAVLHCEDETLGTNVIAQVLQRGYRLGDKMIRHAMVKVAN